MTTFSLRMSRSANGVSRRHGAVAREMWQGLLRERAREAVPITHVTNGVHLPSWVGAPMRRLLDRHPVQFELAGKAHPSDEEGKRVVQEMFLRFEDAPPCRTGRRLSARL